VTQTAEVVGNDRPSVRVTPAGFELLRKFRPAAVA